MFRPDFLQKGDHIGIVSTARKISPEQVEPAINLFESWGLVVRLGDHVYDENHQFSGSDEQRRSDLQKFIDQPDIKAVVCARGGYGTVRILDQLNLKPLKENPKWFVGFSDITALHLHLYSLLKIETIHGTMPVSISSQPGSDELLSNNSLKSLLFGESLTYDLKHHPLNKPGDSHGTLIGGNLSMIYSLLGSKSIPSLHNCILFLEDLDEYLYHIDRMMMNLKRNGVFDNLSGVIIGGMSDMNDNTIPFGKTAEEIIYDYTKEISAPVYFGFSAGHISPNLALPMGRKVTILNNQLIV